jgi:hypothetical protein
MGDISKIKVSGVEYDVKDETARGMVRQLSEKVKQCGGIFDVTQIPSSAEELPNLTSWAETENAGEYSWSAYYDDAPIPEGYYTIEAPDGKIHAFSIPNRSIRAEDEFTLHQVELLWNAADGISGTETFEYYEYDRFDDVHRRRTITAGLQFSELNENALYRLDGNLYYYTPGKAKRLATEDDIRELSEEMESIGAGSGFVASDTAPTDTSVLWVDTSDNSNDGFNEAVNMALAQAKASGEFDGKDGKDGKTPVKGTDYFTAADKAELVSAVIAALPVYAGEVV